MKPEPHDPILDACLEEILGGHTPPDLSDSILENWQRLDSVASPEETVTDSSETNAVVSPPIASSPLTRDVLDLPVQRAIASGSSTDQQQPVPALNPSRIPSRAPSWSRAATLVSILTIGACLGLIAIKVFPPQQSGTPANTVAENTRKSLPAAADSSERSQSPDKKDSTKETSALTTNNKKPATVTAGSPADGFKEPQAVPNSSDTASGTRVEAADNQAIIQFVNQALSDSWQAQKLSPSPRATDTEWCRRVYVRLLGRIPTKQELDHFVNLKSSRDKRVELVDRLLDDQQYTQEYARHWTTIWTNLLIGRRGGLNKGDLSNRQGLQQYLQDGFQENKPYDQMAYELISATGSNTPGTKNYNGAVNFILANMNDHAVLATARTSRVFLGKQLQCVQCHKHPNNRWAQQDFWEMNAFFQQAHVVRNKQTKVSQLVNRDFVGKQGNPEEAEIYFDDPGGSMRVAYPRFPGGKPLSHNGQVDQFDRRTELAKLVQQSDDLSRAMVNRVWAHFLGFGFTRPIDDMGHHNPPTHPELLDHLAKQFTAHSYDMKDLFRWITLSDAFSLSSRLSDANTNDTPELGQPPQFSRYYTRPMQPEEVYQSLLVVAGQDRSKSSPGEIEQARRDWLSQFARKLGTDEGDESDLFAGNIHQSLVIMNGPLMERATDANTRSVLARVLESKMETTEKVEHLFLTAVARKPTKRELKLVQQMMEKTSPHQMLQDIWWALLNSNEFILDH